MAESNEKNKTMDSSGLGGPIGRLTLSVSPIRPSQILIGIGLLRCWERNKLGGN